MMMKLFTAFLALALGSCGGYAPSSQPTTAPAPQFASPQPVTIVGYSGDAMEPFISRDGKYLFFNNLVSAPVIRLYYATEIDPLHFQFQGEVGGVNTGQLNAVASMDLNQNFYFISNRSYAQNLATIYTGAFAGGSVSGVAPVSGISAPHPGLIDFDAEISADGNTLYFTEGQYNNGQLQSTQNVIATRSASGFTRSPQSAAILQQINTNGLNYALDTSSSELEIFFTHIDPSGLAASGIFTASRPDKASPFGVPSKITAIVGFVEAPSISPDGKTLYYHLKDSNGQFVIYCVTRP